MVPYGTVWKAPPPEGRRPKGGPDALETPARNAARRARRSRSSLLLAVDSLPSPSPPGCRRAPSGPMTDERFAKLTASFQEELDDLRKRSAFPGAVAAIEWSDGRTAIVATGLADREAGTPMPKDARLLAGSVGKSFVGAVALGLVKDGKLALDGKIETWLGAEPWFEKLPNAHGVTLRMLLTHSSGLPDHIYEPEFAAAIKAARELSGVHAGLVRQTRGGGRDDPRQAAEVRGAGKGFAYSDTNYILAGLVIEKAAGRPYYDELHARFLAPLGLAATVPPTPGRSRVSSPAT